MRRKPGELSTWWTSWVRHSWDHDRRQWNGTSSCAECFSRALWRYWFARAAIQERRGRPSR